MGIDFLAIQFELEKRLEIRRLRGDFADFDLTAGGLDEFVWQTLQNERRSEQLPRSKPISREDCWLVVQESIAAVLALEPEEIKRESHLIKDLGME